MIKNCVSCHRKFVLPRTDDEPERFVDFCLDCLFQLQAAWPRAENADLPEAPDETPRLHHSCCACVELQRRETDRERMGSALAWGFLWWCVGLASSVYVNQWLGF